MKTFFSGSFTAVVVKQVEASARAEVVDGFHFHKGHPPPQIMVTGSVLKAGTWEGTDIWGVLVCRVLGYLELEFGGRWWSRW